MLSFLPKPVLGTFAGILYLFSLLLFSLLIIVVALLAMIPIGPLQKFFHWVLHKQLLSWWQDFNNFIMWLTAKIEWDVEGVGAISVDDWYLLVSNHLSWLDILVLQRVFNRRAPFLKFFMKQELLWQLPLGGLACWLLGYPFLKRYSKDYLKKHPEKKGKDVESVLKACQKLKQSPSAVLNYIEGTRFTQEKHQKQNSPFKHLLKPKYAGFAFLLNELSDQIKHMINVTIVYPHHMSGIWDFYVWACR